MHRLLPVEIELQRLRLGKCVNKAKSDILKAWNFYSTQFSNPINTHLYPQIQFECLASPTAFFTIFAFQQLAFNFISTMVQILTEPWNERWLMD